MTKLPVLRHTSQPMRFTPTFTGEVVHVILIKPVLYPFERGLVFFGFLSKLLIHVSGRKLKRLLIEFGFSWFDPHVLWKCIWSNSLTASVLCHVQLVSA